MARSNYENKQKAIFLDRDGVINEERGLFSNPDDLVLFDFSAKAIKKINNSDYKAIVVTNQPSIAKNIASLEELHTIHKKMETVLGEKGAKLDEIYFCPHHPEKGFPGERVEFKIDCDCRKPKPGMLLKAVEEFNIDLNQSFIIGDTEKDILAGKSAGCYTIGVMTGFGLKKSTVFPDYFFTDLNESVDFLLNNNYEKYFKELVSGIESNKPYIIGIGGNARCGKSNFASYLKMRFEQSGFAILKIELDNWILPEAERSSKMNVYDRFRLLDMKNDLEKLIDSRTISVISYPNRTEPQSVEIKYNIRNYDVVLIEGVVALSSPALLELYHKKVFVSTSEEKRKQRFEKYYLWKGKSSLEIEALYRARTSDEYELIEKDRKFAGLVIEN
jgi:histidinol-phosphate phosphatase family protein